MRGESGVRSMAMMVALGSGLFLAGCGGDEPVAADPAGQSVSSEAAITVRSPRGPVPPGKMVAPNGALVDLSCVVEVPSGAEVTVGGDIKLNHHVIGHRPRCTSPQTSTAVAPPTTNHEWVAYTQANQQDKPGTLNIFNRLQADWNVPLAIQPNAGGVLYFFPSFTSFSEIIQPVLQWGNNGEYGGYYWSLVSWYWSASAPLHSTPISASPGDPIHGEIVMTDAATYRITTKNMRTGQSTVLYHGVVDSMDTTQGGVLEVIAISTCTQYPSSPLVFKNFGVWQAGTTWSSYIAIRPNLVGFTDTWDTPQCGFNATSSYDTRTGFSSTTLTY